jgi:hypothetical protein
MSDLGDKHVAGISQNKSQTSRVALDNPTIASDLNSRGYIPSPSTPAQFKAQFIKSEKDLGDIIRSRNITLDK